MCVTANNQQILHSTNRKKMRLGLDLRLSSEAALNPLTYLVER